MKTKTEQKPSDATNGRDARDCPPSPGYAAWLRSLKRIATDSGVRHLIRDHAEPLPEFRMGLSPEMALDSLILGAMRAHNDKEEATSHE